VRVPQRVRNAPKADRIVKPQVEVGLEACVHHYAGEPAEHNGEVQPVPQEESAHRGTGRPTGYQRLEVVHTAQKVKQPLR